MSRLSSIGSRYIARVFNYNNITDLTPDDQGYFYALHFEITREEKRSYITTQVNKISGLEVSD